MRVMKTLGRTLLLAIVVCGAAESGQSAADEGESGIGQDDRMATNGNRGVAVTFLAHDDRSWGMDGLDDRTWGYWKGTGSHGTRPTAPDSAALS